MEVIKTENITYVKADKFKTNQIKIAFMFYNSKDYLKYILLANCLFNGTKNHPTKRALNDYIESLYDANLSIAYKTFGMVGEFYFYSSFVMDKYAYQGITKDIVFLINDLLTKPCLENGKFKKGVFIKEKALLKQALESEFDNKYAYAYKKMQINNAVPNSYNPLAYIDIASLESISEEDVMQAYYNLLANKNIKVYIYGEVDLDDFTIFKTDYKEVFSRPVLNFFSLKTKYLNIFAKTNQTILGICYLTNVNTYDEKKRHAMFLFNNIFGGTQNSLLFRIVREKYSLCYTISSTYNPFDGSILVLVGLDKSAKDKALELILQVLEKIKSDDYDEVIYQNAKKNMLNSILDSQDDAYTILSREEMKYIYQSDNSLEKIIKLYNDISRKDISEMAKLLKEDLVLTLGEKNENI